jgi:hypothetical protein
MPCPLFLPAHALEFLGGLFLGSRLFDRHELAGRLVALGPGGDPAELCLKLGPLFDGSFARVIANRLIDRQRAFPSMRVCFVPFFQIGRRAGSLLFFFSRSLPGLIGLLGVLPVGLLAWVVVWFFFAHVAPRQNNPKQWLRFPKPPPVLIAREYSGGFCRVAIT